MLQLLRDHPIFIGLKADPALRQKLEALSPVNQQYISTQNSSFLRLCRLDNDLYVGKLVQETLTTDRVEDIRCHILSILRRLGTEVRLPAHLKIMACSASESCSTPAPA